MNNLRVMIFHDHRNLFFLSITTILSFLALSPTPSAAAIVLTLTTLLVYGQRAFSSQYAFRDTLWLGTAISFSGTLAKASPSRSALSSPGGAIAILFVLNVITSTLAISSVYLQNRLGTRLQSPWSQLTLFPALWATLWYGVSFVSPVGRLSAWSSTEGAGFYGWMIPYSGSPGNDWVVAAWAVVLSRVVWSWYMGEDPEEIHTTAHTAPATKQNSLLTQKSSSLLFTGLLVALALPSLLFNNFPLTVVGGPQITPLSVGCVLPPYQSYHHHTLSLEDYIKESQKLTSANLLLWPEGAVTFTSENDMMEGIERVRTAVKGPVVGVSFEENFGDPESGKSSSRRTGIALVSQTSTLPEIYYKRHLVPVAESFSLTPFNNPPNITTIPLKAPNYIDKPTWVPDGPPYVRSVPVTTSICLDFAHPSQFYALESRPALILAPARTWDIAVGSAMWQQARQRAEELGSMVLWCDGGDGGVSGIAGGGFHDFLQVGLGSWVKIVGVSYPFDERRTIYARSGVFVLVFIWLLTCSSAIFNVVTPWLPSRIGSTWPTSSTSQKRYLESSSIRRPRGLSSPSTLAPNLPPWQSREPDWEDDFVFITHRDLPIPLDKPSRPQFVGAYPFQSASLLPSQINRTPQQATSQAAKLRLPFTLPPYAFGSPPQTSGKRQQSLFSLKIFTRFFCGSSSPNPVRNSPTLYSRSFQPKPKSILASTGPITYSTWHLPSRQRALSPPIKPQFSISEKAPTKPLLTNTQVGPVSFYLNDQPSTHHHLKEVASNQTSRKTSKMFNQAELPPLRDLSDFGGKRTDVVDFGIGMDYGDQAWFQNRPERPQPTPPQPEYTPAPDVISMNDAFEYALSSAPNVLYARYKQYGQLGVLAWCSEFSELIDGLKELGFEGNMFTTTRSQALETCAQLLKLPMEIDMQLIIMYLSGQVSRLRHFLDSETVWDDYPIPKFPVHPPQVSISLPVL
ncbi:hypothetical protein H0H92_000153 [Tricholoma furcatifolium]|nr:hypothetical protein H0H92_000153 [Tricholoma furcatifolium]